MEGIRVEVTIEELPEDDAIEEDDAVEGELEVAVPDA